MSEKTRQYVVIALVILTVVLIGAAIYLGIAIQQNQSPTNSEAASCVDPGQCTDAIFCPNPSYDVRSTTTGCTGGKVACSCVYNGSTTPPGPPPPPPQTGSGVVPIGSCTSSCSNSSGCSCPSSCVNTGNISAGANCGGNRTQTGSGVVPIGSCSSSCSNSSGCSCPSTCNNTGNISAGANCGGTASQSGSGVVPIGSCTSSCTNSSGCSCPSGCNKGGNISAGANCGGACATLHQACGGSTGKICCGGQGTCSQGTSGLSCETQAVSNCTATGTKPSENGGKNCCSGNIDPVTKICLAAGAGSGTQNPPPPPPPAAAQALCGADGHSNCTMQNVGGCTNGQQRQTCYSNVSPGTGCYDQYNSCGGGSSSGGNPPPPPVSVSTVTCYSCTAALTDANACVGSTFTGTSCPAGTSGGSTGCGAAVGGACAATGVSTVTCYRCSDALNDGNSCEPFVVTGSACVAGSSTDSASCAAVVGGACASPTSIGGTFLPNTALISDEADVALLGGVFLLLGIVALKFHAIDNAWSAAGNSLDSVYNFYFGAENVRRRELDKLKRSRSGYEKGIEKELDKDK